MALKKTIAVLSKWKAESTRLHIIGMGIVEAGEALDWLKEIEAHEDALKRAFYEDTKGFNCEADCMGGSVGEIVEMVEREAEKQNPQPPATGRPLCFILTRDQNSGQATLLRVLTLYPVKLTPPATRHTRGNILGVATA